jgi:hypothetical protein
VGTEFFRRRIGSDEMEAAATIPFSGNEEQTDSRVRVSLHWKLLAMFAFASALGDVPLMITKFERIEGNRDAVAVARALSCVVIPVWMASAFLNTAKYRKGAARAT